MREGLAELLGVSTLDKPVVCVHPAAGNPLRMWPPEHFAELIDLILLEYDVTPVLIGGEADRKPIDSVLAALRSPDAVQSLVGRIPLRSLPLFLSQCALMIGNNSGPQHLAAGLGVPTVGIYSGVVDAREWAPLGPTAVAVRRDMSCSPCYFALLQQCPRDVACLKELKPGDVLEACRKMLLFRAGGSRRDSGRTFHGRVSIL